MVCFVYLEYLFFKAHIICICWVPLDYYGYISKIIHFISSTKKKVTLGLKWLIWCLRFFGWLYNTGKIRWNI